MERFLKRGWAEIDLDQLRANYEHIQSLIPPETKIMAILKADAYGCGDIDCARALNRYKDGWYGVSNLNEALRVRSVSEKPVLILTYTDPAYAGLLAEEKITQAIVSLDYARLLSQAARQVGKVVDVHIKLDTGMNRIGLCAYGEHWEQAVTEAEEILKDPWLHVTGIFTHVTTTYEYELEASAKAFADEQLAAYRRVTEALVQKGYDIGLRHACNSGGILNVPELAGLDMVRAGCALYGIYPRRCMSREEHFENVLSFKASVLHVKDVEAGQYFSYSMTGHTDKPLRVATISIGYADGFRRCLGNIGRVLLNGHSCQIMGRVCMDQIIVDVTEAGFVTVGDEAVLMGKQGDEEILVDELCRLAQTGPPEITCLLTRRVQKIYKDGGRAAYRVEFERKEQPLVEMSDN